MTNSDREKEGVKNPENLADVICTSALISYTYILGQYKCNVLKLGLYSVVEPTGLKNICPSVKLKEAFGDNIRKAIDILGHRSQN